MLGRGLVYFYLGAISTLIRFSTFYRNNRPVDEAQNHHTHSLPCTDDTNPHCKHDIIAGSDEAKAVPAVSVHFIESSSKHRTVVLESGVAYYTAMMWSTSAQTGFRTPCR